ncbi:MAG: heavy metal-associated domain-containing protein [Elusimicrobiota bacterium]
MRSRVLAAFLFLAAAARAADAPAFTELPSGRYAVALSGMLCAVCSRAIAAEWMKLPEVESAAIDYEKGSGVVTIRLGRKLQVKALRKALRRADRVANLGGRFELRDIRYIP